MNNMKILYSKFLVTIFCLLISGMISAATPPPAVCEAALSWTTTEMDFGNYVGGTNGTITMDPDTAALTPVGVVLVGGGTVAAATYVFTTTNADCLKSFINITLPADISINDSGPTSTIIINNLVTSIAPQTKFKLSKLNTIKIGGTLNATSTDTPDAYVGPFTVIFSY